MLSFIRSWFNQPGKSKRNQARRFPNLRVESLEDRTLPATFLEAGATLSLSLATNEKLALLSNGTSYTLSLAATGTWSGTNSARVSGNTLSALTVSSAGISAFSTAINITDSASSSDAVSFNDSTGHAYANNFGITLTHSTSGVATPGLAFSGSSIFAGASTLTAAVNGDILINSGASVTSVGGAVSLAATGANAPLTVNGSLSSGTGAETLLATGGITVGTNATITSTAGSLTLGADVKVNGSGDDGVGTLTINAYATLDGVNITLRGADEDIAGTAKVGNASSTSTFASGLSGPSALAIDNGGNLYVANEGNGTVSKYTSSGVLVNASFISGLSVPNNLVFNRSSGHLYVTNFNAGTVSEYTSAGVLVNASLISGLSSPEGLAIDSTGHLYVSSGSTNTVSEYTSAGVLVNASFASGLNLPTGLAFDSLGNLYVSNFYGGTVSEFTSAGVLINASFASGLNGPQLLDFDSNGNLYVANYYGGTVAEYSASGTLLNGSFASGLSNPTGLVFDSRGNLYVSNNGNNTISKVRLAAVTNSVTIQSSTESRPMSIGGSNNSAVAGINLTSAELARIVTSSSGTITFGDINQTGNITFSGATPATTPRVTTVVVQSTAAGDGIILDDSNGTALDGNGGTISLTAGTGGLTALNAADTTPEIATSGVAVTLNTTGAIGTSSNPLQFADNANSGQQNVVIGATDQPGTVHLDGLGSLTLGNVLGGIANTTMNVTARTNLVVVQNALIYTGTGSLSLGADLAANGSGNDGVGTLTISAGVDLAGANITLRGAAEDIASTASIGGDVATSTFAAGGLGGPTAMAFDKSGNLYVTNSYGGTVSKYTSSGVLVNASFASGLFGPEGLAIDSSGNLYVTNFNNNTVSKYSSSGALVNASLISGLSEPYGLTLDRSANPNLYVANASSGTVSEYTSAGVLVNASFASGVNGPAGLAFDSSGNLYVVNSGGAYTVSEYTPSGALINASLITGLSGPAGLAIDSKNNIYVANQSNNTVSEYNSSGALVNASIAPGLNYPVGLAIDSSDNLYISNYFANTVSKVTRTVAANSVTIQSSVESRPMSIGGGNNSAVAGINLTSAELARIFTSSSGTISFGDSNQTGNITFSGATTATTAGASTVVVQSTSSPGAVVLDNSNGTALDGNGGTVHLTPGTGGLSADLTTSAALISTKGFTATGLTLDLSLNFAPTLGQQVTLIQDTGSAISGAFTNLPAGGISTVNFGATPYPFVASYTGGSGDDLVLTAVPTAQFGLADETVNESAGTFSIAVTLSAASTLDTMIPFSVTDGTAVSGTDYSGLSGPLVIAAGSTTGTITGTLIDASTFTTTTPTLVLTLETPTNATLGSTMSTTLTITKDVAVIGSTLQITGDNNAQSISLRLESGDSSTLQVLASGSVVGSFATSSFTSISVQLAGGNDSLSIDTSNGNPVPAAGFTLDGGAGSDTLVGPNSTSSWAVTAPNAGTLNTASSFSHVETVVGGSGDDTYNFDTDTNLGSIVLNEASGGRDTLDFSASSLGVHVNLSTATSQTINSNLALTLSSGASFENVAGGSGNDVLTGDSLNNTLNGEAGNDLYVFDADTQLGNDTLSESTGTDTLTFSATTTKNVAVNLGLATAQVVNSNLTLTLGSVSTIENVLGGSLDDKLSGNNRNNILNGGAGNDTYFFDTDTPLGSDIISESGVGSDTVNFANTTTKGVAVNLGLGTAQVVNSNLTLTLGSASTIENVVGGTLDDTFTGNNLNNSFSGLGGNDTYAFNTNTPLGSDTVTDSSGTDTVDFSGSTAGVTVNLASTGTLAVNSNLTLTMTSVSVEKVIGGSGGDFLTGNSLTNVLTGGAGNDSYLFDTDSALGSDTIDESGGGNDTLDFSGTTTTTITLNLGTATAQVVNSNLTLTLGSASTVENVLGGSLNDTLTGNSLNNILSGGAGNDTLSGGNGRDILIGGAGADSLSGGNEEDLLLGAVYSQANNVAALNALMAEWGRTDVAYQGRIDHLDGANTTGANNGPFLLTTTGGSPTVTNDTVADVETGNASLDWFFSHSGEDNVIDASGEVITTIP